MVQLTEAEDMVGELNRMKVYESFAVTRLTDELLDEYVENIEVHPGMRSGSAGSKYCERGACQRWQASFLIFRYTVVLSYDRITYANCISVYILKVEDNGQE